MLKIRLQRVGKKHEPVYRVVVCDSKNGVKSGNNLEILGAYDAREKNETKINKERAAYWISQGAQVSGTVHNVLVDMGVIKGKKINVLPKKTAPVKEAPVVEPVSAEGSDVAEEEAEVVETAIEENPASPEATQDEAENTETAVEVKEESLDDARDKTEVLEKVE